MFSTIILIIVAVCWMTCCAGEMYYSCHEGVGPLPAPEDCMYLFEILKNAATQSGYDMRLLYGPDQPNTKFTSHLPRVWQIENSEERNTCAVMVTLDPTNPDVEEVLGFSDLRSAGDLVLNRCIRREGMIGFGWPGIGHKLMVGVIRSLPTAKAAEMEWSRIKGEFANLTVLARTAKSLPLDVL